MGEKVDFKNIIKYNNCSYTHHCCCSHMLGSKAHPKFRYNEKQRNGKKDTIIYGALE
jgi:hypothetical protein